MVYFYLVLSSVCSLLVAHLLKLTESEGLSTLNTLTINYAIAAIAAFAIGFKVHGQGAQSFIIPEYYVLIFCIATGLIFISNFMAYSKSVHVNGMGISIAAMRLSLLLPILVSVYFYAEMLSWYQLMGIVMVFGAFLLLLPQGKSLKIGKINASWLLLIVFLLTGFADSSLKVYNEEFNMVLNELVFMGWIYSGAFGIGASLYAFRRGPMVTRQEAKMGVLLGIPNLYSAVFLIYALDGISGAVAFPVVNILNVLGGTMLGVLIWKDEVSARQWGGIVVAIASILLLV